MKKINVIFINIIVFVSLFLIAELGVRLFTSYNGTFEERKNENLIYDPSGLKIQVLRENQSIIERGNKDNEKYHINRHGFRGSDIPFEKKPNEIRIAVIGGSHVFDLNAFDCFKNSWPQLLETKFQENTNINVRVLNFGEPGSRSFEFSNKIILDISKFSPDYIIINSIWNDLKWIQKHDFEKRLILWPPSGKNPFAEKTLYSDDIFGWSMLYRKFRDLYFKIKLKRFLLFREDNNIQPLSSVQNKLDIPNRQNYHPGLKLYELLVKSAIQSAKIIGAKPILAIEERLPSRNLPDSSKNKINYGLINNVSHSDLIYLLESCDSILNKIAKEDNLSIINLNPIMAGRDEYFSDHIHTTNKGSSVIADGYFNFLIDSLKISRSNQ